MLDRVASLHACKALGCDYILQLEDDVIAADGFDSTILNFADRRLGHSRDAAFYSFFSIELTPFSQVRRYYAHTQAVLFRNDTRLDRLLKYCVDEADEAPFDWLLRD